MAELLFIATIVFVAYVVFVVVGEKNETTEAEHPRAEEDSAKAEESVMAAEQGVVEVEQPATITAVPSKTVAKTPRSRSSAGKTVASAQPVATAILSDTLKNPKTGEISKIPSTYNFAKRWIKDALVEEGLLEKVYKTNELDDAANAKIQNAIQQLRAMEKYQ